ncbi:MAG TPA: hypothetical protein DC001_05540, partial [Clostridiales bacterium]|nr:hypothetical protein [Clostridiales bacterium]
MAEGNLKGPGFAQLTPRSFPFRPYTAPDFSALLIRKRPPPLFPAISITVPASAEWPQMMTSEPQFGHTYSPPFADSIFSIMSRHFRPQAVYLAGQIFCVEFPPSIKRAFPFAMLPAILSP